MRTCRKCGATKEVAEFRSKTQCRACYNAYQLAWYHAHREQVTERWRAQRAADPDAIRAKEKAYWDAHREEKQAKDARHVAKNLEQNRQRARDWKAANSERAKEASRRYYAENRERLKSAVREYSVRQDPEVAREKKRDYYQRNREQLLGNARLRRQRDPGTANGGSRRRRAQKRAVGKLLGFHTESEWKAKLAEFDGRCVKCGTPENITRDHIVPLSRGGADTIDNIQPLCISCNARKGARVE